jgi:hypothetical protein
MNVSMRWNIDREQSLTRALEDATHALKLVPLLQKDVDSDAFHEK